MILLLSVALLAPLLCAAPGVHGVETCALLEPVGETGCPQQCSAAAGIMTFQNCQACKLMFGEVLGCSECKPGYSRVQLDDYLGECLLESKFGCPPGGFDAPTSGTDLRKPCSACGRGRVGVYATNAGWFDDAAPSWSAKKLCRSCSQLGCPGVCRSLMGCTRCPKGSVSLQTGPASGLSTWIGKQPSYETGEAAPVLPAICIKVAELKCARGKHADGKGCTACPRGKKLRGIKPQYLAGSRSIQFQPLGQACY